MKDFLIITKMILISFFVYSSMMKTKAQSFTYRNESAYVGCWSGMRGGKLKITSNRIYDLGSKEKSLYKSETIIKKEIKGLQTGEEYILKAKNTFPKSFLAKFIKLSFNSDGTVGIITYNSRKEYVKNDFEGQGLFEKVSCNNFK